MTSWAETPCGTLSDHNPERVRGASILVTGGTGFLGRHLVAQLLREGADVAVLSRRALAPEAQGLRAVTADLSEPNSLRDAVTAVSPDIVVHLAGYTDPIRDLSKSGRAIAENLTGTIALAEAARDVQAFVHIGTGEEYGRQHAPFSEALPPSPLSPYSASKLASTLWLKMMHDSFGYPAVTCRLFLAYGPGQSPPKLIPSAIGAALRGEDFPMTSGRQNREFTYVDDVSDALIRAATIPAARGEVINIGTGVQMPISELVELIFALSDARGKPLPGAIADRPNDMQAYAADITRAGKVLGWAPQTPLEIGLRHTINWARHHGDTPFPLGGG